MVDETPQAPMTSKDEESSQSELVATDDPAVELAETDGEPSENALAELPTELFPTFRILNAPVALPAVPGFGPVLDIKQGEPAEDDLVVSFNISATGKAINLERIQFPVTEGARGPERVIRRLRKMRFRPVFEDGEPVESERMTWVFEPKHWAMPRATATESST
jgi:hypothetical protein